MPQLLRLRSGPALQAFAAEEGQAMAEYGVVLAVIIAGDAVVNRSGYGPVGRHHRCTDARHRQRSHPHDKYQIRKAFSKA